MTIFSSADLLIQFNEYSGRPASDDSIADADKYLRLSRGQQAVVADLMTRCPKALYPKVPYQLFPQPYPNGMTVATGTVTLSGASFLAGASITATASVSQFTSASVGRSYLITDPATGIPIEYLVASYSGGTIVTVTSTSNTPTSMQAVAITAWGLGSNATSDGQVFTFGFNANDYPIMPMGGARIYPSLASFPDFAWIEGYDYVNEGTQIRLPNNRTWSGPLYWYGVPQPNDITASAQPALFPEGARELIVWRAAANFADEALANEKLANRMESKYGQAFVRWALAFKTQWSDGAGVGSISGLRMSMAGGSLNGNNWSGL